MSSPMVAGPDLSDLLCRHVSTLPYAALSPRAIEFSRLAVLDGLGVMLAASGLSVEARPFAELAIRSGGRPDAGLFGYSQRVPMAAAAFANGALSHALDYEDAFDAAPTHPNASLLPAAFAVCESENGITGQDLLSAVAVGCDLVCRLALAVRQPLEVGGWYPPPIFGAFGATAAVARLMRLNAAQTRDAFSLLLCQNVCPGEIKYSRDTVIRAVREAFPAQAAVTACLLARAGVRGFEQPFEGKAGFFRLFSGGQFDDEVIRSELGRHFWIEQLSFKAWPCCRGTHAFIEAASKLQSSDGFDISDIVQVDLAGAEVHRMLAEPAQQKMAPRTLIDAKFSLPFTVSLALRGDPLTLGSFTTAALTDPTTLGLASKCRFEVTQQFENNAIGGGVTLRMADGRELSRVIAAAAGGRERPLSREQLVTKFMDCAGHAANPLREAAATDLAKRLLCLESEPDAGSLLRCAIPVASG